MTDRNDRPRSPQGPLSPVVEETFDGWRLRVLVKLSERIEYAVATWPTLTASVFYGFLVRDLAERRASVYLARDAPVWALPLAVRTLRDVAGNVLELETMPWRTRRDGADTVSIGRILTEDETSTFLEELAEDAASRFTMLANTAPVSSTTPTDPAAAERSAPAAVIA
ncbi:hypothetical protein [Microbacterium indicum]|uniref:hypothetical protein n=1 Tax=Microbacterium indicum TaxID=358100 RepID=UPI0004234572|nr:hypothetical protein [Microbacterium indicum]